MTAINVDLGLAKDILAFGAAAFGFATAVIVYRSKRGETKDAATTPVKPKAPAPAWAFADPEPPRRLIPRQRIVNRDNWVNSWRWPEDR